MQVVVVGGGIIGAATAHYLAAKGAQPLVLEACSPACSASGKAGGFLALDWCDGQAVGPLARRSFQLHAELAESLGVDCGYRRVTTHSISVKQGGAPGARGSGAARLPTLPGWVVRENVGQATIIGTEGTTAQVHPELLTKALLQRMQERGGALQLAAVTGVESEGGRLTAVRVQDRGSGEERTLPADAVVFAMGAWSSQLASWLPASCPDVYSGLKVHSIVLADPQQRTTADALFLAYRGTDGKSLEPEVYPRPNGTCYVCGCSDDAAPVPPSAADVQPRPAAIEALRGVAASVSEELGQAEVLQQQACFLPTSSDGVPVIGQIPGLENAFIATAHSCWGILNAPATGEALAELVVDGKASSSDLRPFDPARFARRRR
ncbi:oxidoreductase TDA3 [Chlorella sorokiniana]|uniref:Oxidoreductase TDA3 n=1 Tax=Chlorella sorokiniana TaxID=3076 RepID=A0A2P6TQ60_CHLSO|nr:oxidoreductase TDA3 [Chlorella sorokiniana]|eukprot:PRW56176.1 oxidoreductase TDA3 [Chlorella sorokiniana]